MLEITLDGQQYRILSVKTLSDGKRTRMATAEKLSANGQWREVVNYAKLERLAREYDNRQDILQLDRAVTDTKQMLSTAGYKHDLDWLANCSDWLAAHEAEQTGVPVELVKLYRQSVNDLCGAIFAQFPVEQAVTTV